MERLQVVRSVVDRHTSGTPGVHPFGRVGPHVKVGWRRHTPQCGAQQVEGFELGRDVRFGNVPGDVVVRNVACRLPGVDALDGVAMRPRQAQVGDELFLLASARPTANA